MLTEWMRRGTLRVWVCEHAVWACLQGRERKWERVRETGNHAIWLTDWGILNACHNTLSRVRTPSSLVRERERDVEYGYCIYFIAALNGMTGYLAPFRYLANNKLDFSLIDDARVGIYDCHMLQVTGEIVGRDGTYCFSQKSVTFLHFTAFSRP